VGATVLLAGCGSGTLPGDPGGVRVVAAENFWGSITRQLLGTKGTVDSIIVNPAQDPHAYQPTTQDARTLATAQLVIVDGVGYDPWASQLLAANPTPGRIALNVGDLFGLHEGDNPHRWYDPADVEAVAARIAGDLTRLRPRDGAYFAARLRRFDAVDLAPYHALIAAIRRRFHGVPVGASESIFALLAPALGLDLKTPPSFMRAISEGTEVSAGDTLNTQRQIQQHQIKVWIYNSQNATPQIELLNAMARAARIPIVTITETLSPARNSFEQWQVAQLRRLQSALAEAS
jgi:zinc/manganese transport system substrate-binding protein